MDSNEISNKIKRGVKKAVKKAIEEHRKAGRGIVIWDDDQVVRLKSEEIPYGKREKRLGEKLRTVRLAHGLSLNVAYDICETYAVKLDPSYLSRLERGKVSMPLGTVMALADFYGISLADLFQFTQGTQGSIGTSRKKNKGGFEDILAGVGWNLRIIRASKGMNMQVAYDIQKKYGVKLDPAYLSRMERGKVSIPVRTLLAFADFYNVELSFFFELRDEAAEPELPEILKKHPEIAEKLADLEETIGESALADLLNAYLNILSEEKQISRSEREAAS